jgi:hypothetical protein
MLSMAFVDRNVRARKHSLMGPFVSADSTANDAPSFNAIAGSARHAARRLPIASHSRPWSAADESP